MTDQNIFQRQPGKRGMHRYRSGSIKLKFGDILQRHHVLAQVAPLPPLPASGWYGHLSNHEPFNWDMLGNDDFGCCVAAGACHETMVLRHASRNPVPSFNRQTALNLYSQMLVDQGGRPLNPRDPSTDTGLDPTQAAAFRRRVGVLDAANQVHKIDAFAEINNWHEAMYAIHLFGIVGVGVALPDNAETFFSRGDPWHDTSEPGGDGHYIPGAQLNSKGDMAVVTWGRLQGISKPWLDKYGDVLIAYVSREYMMANGKSPEAIDWEALNSYLASVKTV